MASGMVRAAAVAFQEEKEGLETSKSESFCKKFLSTICENEKNIELFDTFSQTLVKELNKIFGRVPSRMKSADGKMEKIWSAFTDQYFARNVETLN